MIDMAKTIIPKSDQMNYDDFLTGPKNITVTKVTSTGNTNDAQPVSIHYEGDNGKPYKPCKSMRRVMVKIWGNNALDYIGKSMTLFGDQDVIFGGAKVGGIRISHMSHLNNAVNVPLSASKTKRILYNIQPLTIDVVGVGDFDEVLENAKESASDGFENYKNFFNSLSAENKKKLNDSGDHEKLKQLSKDVDSEPNYNMG